MTPESLQLVFNIIATIYMVFLGTTAKTENFVSAIVWKVIPMGVGLTGIALLFFQ